ncbi:transporter substrate-binding domain-containing protein [Pseudomonas sp. GX19020]|uniref:transporter substrate-binding domain-containing protein n=1 Tax=Pseudomonas sp. GX19020 TaxID=2942277 RepID=UPI002018C1D0|nr:transporter substrate-binding domain-containing protein [Pseudomonas sp. GX19020]MCL4068098.1 transporter substrate-binding domain-containing protein [Pseudomonas sp. GX19020]
MLNIIRKISASVRSVGLATSTISVFAAMIAGSASAVTLEEIQARGVMNIGIYTDQPPFSFIDSAGANQGYDIDLTAALAERFGVRINYVSVTSANRISQLQTGKVDLLAMPFGVFPDRATAVKYIAPYASILANVYGPVDDPLTEMSQLSGRSIALERGSSMDTDVTELAPPDTVLLRFDDASAAVQALLSGQAEFFGSFNPQFMGVEAAAPGIYEAKIQVDVSYLSYVVAPDSEELAVTIGENIKGLVEDGTMETLYQKYFKTAFPFPVLPKELKGVAFAVSSE